MLQKDEFLGTLIGIALRTHAIMPLDLAEVVWKTLTHEGANEKKEGVGAGQAHEEKEKEDA